MKALVWCLVVGFHGVVFCALFFIQGCGIRGEVQPPPPPPMPPRVHTPSPAPPPVRPSPVVSVPIPVEDVKEYTVRKGDSLSVIAHRYGVSVGEIMDLNTITDKDVIRVGQTLKLPGRVDLERPVEKTVTRTAPAVSPVSGETYVVQSGDTLSEIALRFGTTVAKLREANNLSGDLIKVGQKLNVGAAVSKPKPAAPKPAVVEQPRPVAPAVDKAPVFEEPESLEFDDEEDVAAFAGTGIIHVVQAGETLEQIATLYDTTAAKIAEFNQLEIDEPLAEGTRVGVP